MQVAVVKLGVGNTASVMFALERLNAEAALTDDVARIRDAERVILPGVGTARHAMERLASLNLIEALRAFPRPLLGLCLGQQLLFERSDEGDAPGLGLIEGKVTKLPASVAAPSPHMGWSRLYMARPHPLFEGVPDGAYAYFVHSYVCPVSEATLAEAEYGTRFAAAVGHGNRLGCQFHPERSGAIGQRILANFLALPC